MAEILGTSLLRALSTNSLQEAVMSSATWLGHEKSGITAVRSEIESIKDDLDHIQSFLRAADRAKEHDEDVADWVEQIRSVAHDVEDVVGDFLYSCQARAIGRKHSLVRKFSDHRDLHTTQQIAERLQKIKPKVSRIRTLSDRHMNNRLAQLRSDSMVSSGSGSSRRHSESLYGMKEHNIVGTEENESKLIGWLVNVEEPSLVERCKRAVIGTDTRRDMAVAVWGVAGLGKTTLVRKVYNHPRIRKHFDCCAWVSISKTCKDEEVLRCLLIELSDEKLARQLNATVSVKHVDHGDRSITKMGREELMELIRVLLFKKRYMIVFDDVWSPEFLDDVCSVFHNDGENGSRILITTSHHIVAASVATTSHILPLQRLPKKEAWSLFCEKAFCKYESMTCPDHLEPWASKIVDSCQGLPLAVVTMGSLMCSIDDGETMTWESSYQSLNMEFKNSNILNSAVMLSFYELPYHLKQCFLYCIIFPEDRLIKRKQLIRLWVAEEFIEEKDGVTLEQTAEECLQVLIFRNMLQVAETNESGRVKACILHDVVRASALEISGRENLCKICDGNRKDSGKRARCPRRLSVLKCADGIPLTESSSYLRSLFMFEQSISPNSPSFRGMWGKLKLLRILDLTGLFIEQIPDEVFVLFNLHYLSLRDTKIKEKEFPATIEKLQYLQTLDLWGTGVEKLPREILKLRRLRHLLISSVDISNLKYRNFMYIRGREAPEGICDMKCLQTLKTVKANQETIDNIAKLTQLKTLSIMDTTQQQWMPLCAAMSEMNHLTSLSISAAQNEQLQLEDLTPSPHLQKLLLSGKLVVSHRWFNSLHSLTHLYLLDSKLSRSPLYLLGNLHSLVFVMLESAYVGEDLVLENGWFLNLRMLCLKSMATLKSMVVEEGALSKLSKLSICDCKLLKEGPQGIEHLTSLEMVFLKGPTLELKTHLERVCGTLGIKLKLV